MFKTAIIHIPSLNKNNSGQVESNINYCASGLFSIARELQNQGFYSEIINLGIEKYLDKNFLLSDYLKENNFNYAALSMQWHKQTYDVIECAREIKKKNPNVHISLGGMTASYFAEDILKRFNFIDSIIMGDGEIPTRELVLALSSGNLDFSNVPNLCYIKDGKFILNEPLIAPSEEEYKKFSFFNPGVMKHYIEYLKAPFILNYSKENELNGTSHAHIALGRGCLGNCLWCGGCYSASKRLSGRTDVVYRNIDDIVSEIKALNEKYNVESFSFSFDPKGKDRSFMINLFNKIKCTIKTKIKVYYNLDGLPDKEFLYAFGEAFSVDSILGISPVFQNEDLRKKYKSFYYSNSDLENALNIAENLKIKSDIYFSVIKGIPEAENVLSKKYGDYLKNKYKYINDILIYPVELEPGARLFECPEKYSISEKRKTFDDFYNETYSIEKSFENENLF